MQTSGIRLGTPAVTTRGMLEPEMTQIAEWIDRVVTTGDDKAVLAVIREEVREFCAGFPLPH
jgi:glycine hydroxymethyltransferase